MEITQEEINKLYETLKRDGLSAGYYLNPDVEFTKSLVRGLLVNERRYGYPACPCRLASGRKADDLDIICPCDYRDPDLTDYGACYCGLYVSKEVVDGKKKLTSIPERRPSSVTNTSTLSTNPLSSLPLPVWRCKVCGYLAAREHPPETCPICKAKKDRFERFM